MKKLIFLLSTIVFTTASINAQTPAADIKPEAQIQALVNELRDAAKRKDRAVYERLLADGFFFIHSNGATSNRKMYIDNFAAGVQTVQQDTAGGTIEDERVTVYGENSAVYVARGVLTDSAKNLELHLRAVWAFAKLNGRWQQIYGQTSPLPARPKAASVDFKLYDAYVGEYQVREGVVFTVRREGNTLRTTQTFRQPGELIPKSDTEFIWYNPDMVFDGQVTFIKSADGSVTHVAFRSNGNEIWRAKKIK